MASQKKKKRALDSSDDDELDEEDEDKIREEMGVCIHFVIISCLAFVKM